MDKIIFFHMNQLGDLLFSLPVVKAVKRQYPNIKIYSVVKKNLADLLNSTGLVDKIFIKEHSFKSKLRLIENIRNENIDTAVLFSESPETLITAYCSKIKRRVGFETASLSFLLTDKSNKTGVPSLSNNINLAKKLGCNDVNANYLDIIRINQKADDNVKQWLNENKLLDKDFIVVSAGASKRRQDKCLKKEVWVKTLNMLSKHNIKTVVAGAKWEKDDILNIVQMCSVPDHINIFCPEGGLLELSAMIKRAKLFVGIDSGTMHLAASLGIKCVALYGNTDPFQIGPQPLNYHIIIKRNNAKDITADDIITKINI